MHRTSSFDLRAADALMAGDKTRLEALKKVAEGLFDCPSCGHKGPHEVQSCHGEAEFACAGCGLQHPVPEV